jgi:O-antigen/teichoic acid export membrane protein
VTAGQDATTTPHAANAPRSFVRTTLALVGTRVAVLVSGLIASVLMTRILGPEGRGQYAVVVAMVGAAVAIGHCSVEQSQVYLAGRGANIKALTANAMVLALILGTVAAGMTALVAVVFAYPYRGALGHPALPIALLAIPVTMIVLWTNGLLILEGRTRVMNRAVLLGGLVQVALYVGMAVAHRFTVTTVVLAWTLATAVPLLLTLPGLRPRRVDIRIRLAREAIGFGLRYHLSLVSFFLLLRIDVLMLGAIKDDRAVGLYALAVTLIELTNLVTDAVSTAVLQRQTSLPLEESGRFTARVVGLSGVLAVVAAAGLVAASPALVPLIFGADFRGSLPALFALAPGVVALAMARSAGGYLLRRNRPLVNSVIALTALGVNVALNLLLIPLWGIVGTGVASSIAYILLSGSYLTWLRHAAGVGIGDFRPRLTELLWRRAPERQV